MILLSSLSVYVYRGMKKYFFVFLSLFFYSFTIKLLIQQETTYSIEEQLISLSNVTKASELLFKLGASSDSDETGGTGEPGDSGNIDRQRQRPPRQSFTDQASCEPELHTIDLSNYTHNVDDNNNNELIIFPRCIRVTRCGGCCGPSNLLTCMPTKTSMLDVRRALVKLTPNKGARGRDTTTLGTIQVEQHDACSCQCREKQSDCDPVKHRYSHEKCKCICIDTQGQFECKHPDKWWDPRDCACKCRSILHCSTGLIFSNETCSCEVENIS